MRRLRKIWQGWDLETIDELHCRDRKDTQQLRGLRARSAWLRHHGKNKETLMEEIREAIEFHIEGMREDGEPVPEPRSTSAMVEVAEPTGAGADD